MLYLKTRIKYLFDVYSKIIKNKGSLSVDDAITIWKRYDDNIF